MTVIESLTLDGLALTSGSFSMMEFTVDPPRQRQDWITAADSEYAALVRQPLHENRTITVKVRVTQQASMDLALDQVGALVDKLRSASASPSGIPLVWTPTDSARSCTFTVLAGEITGMPVATNGEGISWIRNRPILTVELTCKPDWLGTALATVTDAFASNSIADYTFDAGAAGNVSITGGVVDAAANLTTENRFLHTASPYDLANTQVTVKHTLGTTVTSYKAGVILKRLDASNYLEVYLDDNGTNSRLRIDRVLAASRTNLASTNLGGRMSVSTAYWVRGRIEGNTVSAMHYTSAPTATTAATTSTSATLAGGDATAFGTGVDGRCGLVWTPQQTAATLDDLEIAPNVFVSATPFVTGEIVGVPGDLPARAVLTVTDSTGQSRRHVEWGTEGPLTYAASTVLLIDSDSLVTSGFAGTQTTRSGAYDPNASGNSAITADLFSNSIAVCGTGDQSHVGVFRVKARVQSTNGTFTSVKLSWRAGDGPLSSNAWVSPRSISTWEELDLGTISVPAATLGSQRWTGQLEAYDVAAAGLYVDYLVLVPVSDGYGKARASYSYTPGVIVGRDEFVGTTATSALNGRTAVSGGTWATSGDATDLVFADNFITTPADAVECVTRSTSASESTGRFGILGSTAYTDMEVGVRIRGALTVAGVLQGVIARWVDSSNHIRLLVPNGNAGSATRIEQVVAGVTTVLASSDFIKQEGQIAYRLRLIVYSSGRIVAHILSDAGSVLSEMSATTSAAATGGALDDGKPGIFDLHVSGEGLTRYYTGFSVATPAAEPIAVYSGRNMQIRYDDVLRQDSAGTYAGRPASYRGSRFLLPVGTSRVMVKARRNDIETSADDNVTDSLQAQVTWTPRGLAVPR